MMTRPLLTFLRIALVISLAAMPLAAEPAPEDSQALDSVVRTLESLKESPDHSVLLQWLAEESLRIESELNAEEQRIAALRAELESKKKKQSELKKIASEGFPKSFSKSSAERTTTAAHGEAIAQVDRPVDFAHEIFPVFERSCIGCHGPDKQRAELRLDSRTSVFEGGLSGPSVTPGQGEQSLLFIRVAGAHGEDQMPPQGDKLSGEEIGLIRAWIDQGADWPEGIGVASAEVSQHWAYLPPVKASLPENGEGHPIDAFIAQRLAREGLIPQPEAEKTALIRRVSLDLIGLPPTLEEVDAFLADTSDQAYEKVVDRLLESPRYGEKWARIWLDLARYADTNGYEKDLSRSMWPWRDWVIQAFNRNLPFDRFTIEQIAGDLLPNPSEDQLVATGFHRNTMLNDEGGIDPEEFRIVAVKDRVDTTAAVWLGTTMNCAQCHNHKYDPFTQEEYYRFLAFFNSTEDMGVGQAPEISTPTEEQEKRLAEIAVESASLEKILSTQTEELEAAFPIWEKEILASRPEWLPLVATEFSAEQGGLLTLLEDGSFLAVGASAATEVYQMKAPLSGVEIPVTGLRIEALTHETLPQRTGPGRSEEGKLHLNLLEVEVQTEGNTAPVSVSMAHADTHTADSDASRFIGSATAAGWKLDGNQTGSLFLRFSEPLPVSPDSQLCLRVGQTAGGAQQPGRFRVSLTSAPDPIHFHQEHFVVQHLITVPDENRDETLKAQIRDHFRQATPLLAEERRKLADLRKEKESILVPTTMIMRELEQSRETHVLERGNFLAPGKKVEAGVPRVLNDFPSDAPRNRLGLAQWLVSRDNPLTARVMVNRIWAAYFGKGLVKTSEDFGTQGDPPTHPELLDWLAVEFMESGWDLKALHRLIVTSDTYKRSSRTTPDLLEADPRNLLYARGPRFRLAAEGVRDNALAIAGLLTDKIGGPSVFPPQPEGIWDNSFAIHDTISRWIESTGPDRYRRGIYTFLRRTAPYPTFQMFDAPMRDVCTVERSRTTTPLQALATLNDPAFLEAAGGLGRRLLMEGGEVLSDRLIRGFRLCTAREPGPRELEELARLFEESFRSFASSPEDALTFIASTRQEVGELDPCQFAASILVANILLNLDETVTKG